MVRATPTILIVEDDSILRRALTLSLKRLGYNIIEAADGEEGLRLAVALPKPNLIILDILLPKLNGHQLLQELRKNNLTKSIPTVILTNDDSEKSFKKALKNGAPAYFAKDHTTLKEVGKIVQYHLGVLA